MMVRLISLDNVRYVNMLVFQSENTILDSTWLKTGSSKNGTWLEGGSKKGEKRHKWINYH